MRHTVKLIGLVLLAFVVGCCFAAPAWGQGACSGSHSQVCGSESDRRTHVSKKPPTARSKGNGKVTSGGHMNLPEGLSEPDVQFSGRGKIDQGRASDRHTQITRTSHDRAFANAQVYHPHASDRADRLHYYDDGRGSASPTSTPATRAARNTATRTEQRDVPVETRRFGAIAFPSPSTFHPSGHGLISAMEMQRRAVETPTLSPSLLPLTTTLGTPLLTPDGAPPSSSRPSASEQRHNEAMARAEEARHQSEQRAYDRAVANDPLRPRIDGGTTATAPAGRQETVHAAQEAFHAALQQLDLIVEASRAQNAASTPALAGNGYAVQPPPARVPVGTGAPLVNTGITPPPVAVVAQPVDLYVTPPPLDTRVPDALGQVSDAGANLANTLTTIHNSSERQWGSTCAHLIHIVGLSRIEALPKKCQGVARQMLAAQQAARH